MNPAGFTNPSACKRRTHPPLLRQGGEHGISFLPSSFKEGWQPLRLGVVKNVWRNLKPKPPPRQALFDDRENIPRGDG